MTVGQARPGRLTPALPAGVAEAPLWFFPVAFVDGQLGGSLHPAWSDLLWFVAGFAAAVGAAAALAGWRAGRGVGALLLAASVVLGLVEGSRLETAQPGGLIAATLIAMVLGLRVGVLGLRDWREPVQLSFGLGAVVLLVTAAGSGFAGIAGRPLMAFAIPMFFLGSLASRAASARLAEGWAPGDGRRVGRSLGAVAAAIGVAGLFGGAGGWFQRLGTVIAPLVGAVLGALLWVAGQLARPLFWLAERFQLNVDELREAFENLREDVGERTGASRPGDGSMFERVAGLAFVVLLVLGLLILFRRLRGRSSTDDPPPGPDRVPMLDLGAAARPRAERPRRRVRMGRAHPEDLVRRWYAEALLALEGLGLLRPPARTPGEFRRDVVATYPELRQAFGALTSAYERVRYGGEAPDQTTLDTLRQERSRVRALLRDAEALPDAAEGTAPAV